MPWQAKLGSTLLIPTGPSEHLHFVCSDPISINGYPPNSCLLLNVSTRIPKCDETCILTPQVAQHPFVVDDSYVAYRYAHLIEVARLEDLVQRGVYRAHAVDVRPALVKWMVARMDQSLQATGGMIKVASVIYADHTAGNKW